MLVHLSKDGAIADLRIDRTLDGGVDVFMSAPNSRILTRKIALTAHEALALSQALDATVKGIYRGP